MFRLFQDLPIKTKLIMVIFSAAMVVTIIGFSFFMFLNVQSARAEAVDRAQSEMNVLAQDFVKLVMFSDAYVASDIVSKLRQFDLVKNVFLYDAEGNQIFRYEDSPSSAMEPPDFIPGLANTRPTFSDQHFQFLMPMRYAGGKYGWVFARISTAAISEKLAGYYQLIAIAIPAMFLVSYLLALWLQRYFSAPIIRLAERVSRIADDGDFDQRVTSDQPNEIGGLYRSIGQLLEAIRYSQSRLHQSEERLEAIIDLAGSALISVDEDYRITLFNHQAEQIFGYAAREVIGKPLDLLLPERFRGSHNQKIDAFSEKGMALRNAMFRSDVRGLRKNGEEFPVEASISKKVLAGKKIFTVALGDITQRRQTEEELAAYRSHLEDVVEVRTAELRAKNSELEAFSYSIAHDLRAPLRSITSFSQVLLDDVGDTLGAKDLESLMRIVSSGQHMAELIDGILDLARIGRTQLSSAEVDLSAFVQKVETRLSGELASRDVRWEVAPNIVARGDRQLLGMMLENLIENAWKYTSKKARAVIEFGVVNQRGKRVYFVKDNGVGFDMKYADHLFSVFHRLHAVEDFEGTGVGLATVQRIIHRHGGSIWAEAAVDKGATFYFTLP
ncbi:MAG: PAS domain S-box protein [Gammaproteobacteria bacterium]|nr:PAS domain S-box protein [Gammaproteobacteria bacterium]